MFFIEIVDLSPFAGKRLHGFTRGCRGLQVVIWGYSGYILSSSIRLYLKICSENMYLLRHANKVLIDCIHFSLAYFNLVMISIYLSPFGQICQKFLWRSHLLKRHS